MKTLTRGISWPLSLAGALLGHGGVALWVASLSPAAPPSAPAPLAVFFDEETLDETLENDFAEIELTAELDETLENISALVAPAAPPARDDDATDPLARANPARASETDASEASAVEAEERATQSGALSDATDTLDETPTSFTDALGLTSDEKSGPALTLSEDKEGVVSFGETSETATRHPSNASRAALRAASRFTRGSARATTTSEGLARPRAPQLRAGSACGDLFARIDRRDATTVLVRVDVSPQGRARLHHLVSTADDPELVRASAACVSRLRFDPAVDATGHESTGLATLRLRLVEPG